MHGKTHPALDSDRLEKVIHDVAYPEMSPAAFEKVHDVEFSQYGAAFVGICEVFTVHFKLYCEWMPPSICMDPARYPSIRTAPLTRICLNIVYIRMAGVTMTFHNLRVPSITHA